MLEVPLGGGTPRQPERSEITIKFTVAVEAREGVNANEVQATGAVNQAREAISALRPTPQVVGQVDSAIGTGTQLATEVQTFENTWNVLLERMALFNKIVAGVAEVSRIRRLAPSQSEYPIDSPVYVIGLVGDIGGEPGLCVARHSHWH